MTTMIAATLAVAAGALGARAPLRADSRVDAVLVMPDRAVVTRAIDVDLPSGRSTITLDGLVPHLDTRTFVCLPADGAAGVRVADVSSELYTPTADPRERLAELERRRDELKRSIETCNDELVAHNERGRVLGEYRKLTTRAMRLDGGGADGPREWTKAIAFIAEQALTTARRVRDGETRKFRLSESLREVAAKIAAVSAPPEQRWLRAFIAVESERAVRARLRLSYLVTREVSWGPRYAARLDRSKSALELESFAIVTQNTGEDWTDAAVTVSTHMPAKGLRPPELEPLFLTAVERTQRPSSLQSVEVETDERIATSSAAAESYVPELGGEEPPPPVATQPRAAPKASVQIARVRAGVDIAEFVATRRVTVKSDKRPVSVALGRYHTECAWHLESIPKLLGSVYTRARFDNPTGAVMLDGRADCYLDGAYIGRMDVPLTAPGAKVDMSFGAARGLWVGRTAEPLSNDLARTKGKRRAYRYAFTIELGNDTREAAEVSVLENVPVSAVDAVTIALDPATTPHDSLDGGRLRWEVALAPGERKKLTLAYTVEIGKGYMY